MRVSKMTYRLFESFSERVFIFRSHALIFTSYYISEYAVWQELSENLANLASIYRSEPFYEDFQCMLKKLYSKQMKILGWDPLPNESQRTGTLRGTVINILRTAGDKDVIVEAFSRFKRFIADPEQYPIPGDLRSIVFKAALRYDEKFVYDKMREIFEKSMFPEEQRACLSVMGSVLDMGRHKEAIDYVLFSGKVSKRSFLSFWNISCFIF